MSTDRWHDFFVMVGGGAAALAGLVFVAMSINIRAVVEDASHRNRAIGTLSGFAAAFLLCGLALMGHQPDWAVGAEWLSVAILSGTIYVNGYVQAVRQRGSRSALSLTRTIFGVVCHLLQVVGAILYLLGNPDGLVLAGAGMMLFFVSLISGAWLLLVGIGLNERE